MKNPYERMRRRLAAAERAKAAGKPRDRTSPRPLAAAREIVRSGAPIPDDAPATVRALVYDLVEGRPLGSTASEPRED